jgi:predicted acetyltransferase
VTASGLQIRPLGRDDDLEPELALRRRAFGPIPAGDKPKWQASIEASVAAGQIFGAFDHGRLVASARYFDMRQWWHGRSMLMAGVAGVKVAPEERGRGVGKALMTELMTDFASRGYPVSALYPSTLQIYRSLGWEIAGGFYLTTIPARALTALAAPDPGVGEDSAEEEAPRRWPAGAGDAKAVIEALGRVHQALRHCGPSTRSAAETDRWLDNDDNFTYLADDGFLSYRWADGHKELRVDLLAAGSAGTSRTFWRILASHATMAETVRACLAPDDPATWLMREPDVSLCRRSDWMLRLVDPSQAIAARGFPASASVCAQLELTDTMRPGNSGSWALEVAGGAGSLTPAGGPAGMTLQLGSRGFAALFAGVPVATLRSAGLAAGGDPAADEALDCAFAGSSFMTDYF